MEVLPPDELPAPIPAAPADATGLADRAPGGRWNSVSGRVAGRLGARASGRPSLVSSLGLDIAATDFRPYRRKAASFRRAHTAELAALAGGTCGTGPSSMVATAALQLAASRYLYDKATATGVIDVALLREARQQGDSARQNLLAAYELAVREGKLRGQPATIYDVDEVTRRAEAAAEERRQGARS